MNKPMFLPTAFGPQDIHISAELRMSAMQLQSYNIGWAASVMERAAKHIDALEDERLSTAQETEVPSATDTNSG